MGLSWMDHLGPGSNGYRGPKGRLIKREGVARLINWALSGVGAESGADCV